MGVWPQRSTTSDVGEQLNWRRLPFCQFSTSFRDSSISSSTASSGTSVCHSSLVRWLSQIESRPNFSPMNICSSSSRTGSKVA